MDEIDRSSGAPPDQAICVRPPRTGVFPQSLSLWRWLCSAVVTGATFSLVFLIDHDSPRPAWEQQVRPVFPRVQPKPYVAPKQPPGPNAAKQQALAAALPPPPPLAARGALFRPVPLAANQTLEKLRLSPLNPPIAATKGLVPGSIGRNPVEVAGEAWRIDSSGQLQRSMDGIVWRPFSMNGNAPFSAVAWRGPDVWAGRPDASLYHSADGGRSWQRVYVQDEQGGPTGPITSIGVLSPDEAQAGTATGERWVTKDAGRSWVKR